MADYDQWKDRPYAKCGSCGDLIRSSYPGEFVACSCFANEVGNKGIFVDQCKYYYRAGGGGSITWVIADGIADDDKLEE